MKRDAPELVAAEAEADAARERLLQTLQVTQHRLHPKALKQEAADKAVDQALGSAEQLRLFAQNHPMQLIGLAAAAGAFAARRPLTSMLKSILVGVGRYSISRMKRRHRD